MSTLFVVLTGMVLAAGAFFPVLALVARMPAFVIGGVLIFALCAAAWLTMRPTQFEIGPTGLTIVFPMRQQRVPGARIAGARIVDGQRALRTELGLAIRIGVGGLFGTFGWLWTTKRGMVSCWVSRTDGMVLIDRRDAGPLLITPERPAEFVAQLSRSGYVLASRP